jgi:hypothetical protein
MAKPLTEEQKRRKSERDKARYYANREAIRAAQREYYRLHREELATKERARRQTEAHREKARRWRAKNRERINAKARARYAASEAYREHERQRNKKWRAECKAERDEAKRMAREIQQVVECARKKLNHWYNII